MVPALTYSGSFEPIASYKMQKRINLCFFLLAKCSELFVQFMFTVGTIRSRHRIFIYDIYAMTT